MDDFSRRAHRVIPGGAHTYSRGDDQFPQLAPQALVRGKGARVWSLAGTEYVDWGMGINNVLIGHAEDAIDDQAVAALRQGQAFSRPSPLEIEAAEALVALFPGMEMAKFAKNGSDANSAAVRLARAVTGRDKIAYDASAPFLAIHDWFIGTTVLAAGVPQSERQLAIGFDYNDLASVDRVFEEHRDQIACVVMEVCREERPAPGFLERIRRYCDEQGTLLVFDEVVTGFRYSLHGAYSLFGVTPDLLSIGKGMANGYAIAALLGRREIMERGGLEHGEERVFLLSTTNGPERSALAATIATITFYLEHEVIASLAASGRRVIDGLAEAATRHGVADLVSARSDFDCRPLLRIAGPDGVPNAAFRTLFLQELMRKGVFMPWVCPSYRLGEDELAQTAAAFDSACRVMARAHEKGSVDELLVGPPARPVFRRYNDGHN